MANGASEDFEMVGQPVPVQVPVGAVFTTSMSAWAFVDPETVPFTASGPSPAKVAVFTSGWVLGAGMGVAATIW
jgi:hypothetical protein